MFCTFAGQFVRWAEYLYELVGRMVVVGLTLAFCVMILTSGHFRPPEN